MLLRMSGIIVNRRDGPLGHGVPDDDDDNWTGELFNDCRTGYNWYNEIIRSLSDQSPSSRQSNSKGCYSVWMLETGPMDFF